VRALALFNERSKVLDELLNGNSAVDTSNLETVEFLHCSEGLLNVFNTSPEIFDPTEL